MATTDDTGALVFWVAVRDVFPTISEQRYWVHKNANVLNALPKPAQPGAKKASTEIWQAAARRDGVRAGCGTK